MTLSNEGYCGLAADSARYSIAKQTDWTTDTWASFKGAELEGSKAEDLFHPIIELNDGRKVRRVECSLIDNEAKARYTLIEEIKEDGNED